MKPGRPARPGGWSSARLPCRDRIRRHSLEAPRANQPEAKPLATACGEFDNFVIQYDPALLRREDGLFKGAFFVDLGYGTEPLTTLESAERFRRLNPRLPVLGVEIDPSRVAAALPYAGDLTHFRIGGFNVPLRQRADGSMETVRLIRALNVLRQYEENEVPTAWSMLAHSLVPGGLLVDGTSEPFGRLWVANLLRKPATATPKGEPGAAGDQAHLLQQEGLVFSTNYRLGFDPADFQAVLPKNLIHRVVPGEVDLRLLRSLEASRARDCVDARLGTPPMVHR